MNANTNPIVDAVKPNLASLKIANVASKPENASVTRNTATAAATGRLVNAWRNASIRPRVFVEALTERDSGSRNHAATKLAKQSADANHIGVSGLIRLSTPPIAGPKMNPSPNAAPTMPMPRARFSGVVTSAM